MKNTFKLFGIIVIAAIIGFSFTACSDDSDGGSGAGDPKTVTFSLDKVSDRSFTITVDGANWESKESWNPVIGSSLLIMTEALLNTSSGEIQFLPGYFEITSTDKVITWVTRASETTISGTVKFIPETDTDTNNTDTLAFWGYYVTDGGFSAIVAPIGNTTYKANPAKSSITFP